MPKMTIPPKWLEPTNKQVSRWISTNEQVVNIIDNGNNGHATFERLDSPLTNHNTPLNESNKTKEKKKWSGPEGLRSLDLWLSSHPHKAPKALPSEGSEDHRDILTTLRAQQVC
jgi:hypothetical protein